MNWLLRSAFRVVAAIATILVVAHISRGTVVSEFMAGLWSGVIATRTVVALLNDIMERKSDDSAR